MESLINYKLITNKISIKNNHIKDGTFSVDPQVRRTINELNDGRAAVTYELILKNTDSQPFPYDIEVSLTGIFDVSKLNEKSVEDFLKVQTCQIIFPQIRTIIANLTASAFLPPLLLPIIDARKLFSDNEVF